MKSHCENPDSEENQQLTREIEREIFALKMQAREPGIYCDWCGMLKSQCDCWDSVNGGD